MRNKKVWLGMCTAMLSCGLTFAQAPTPPTPPTPAQAAEGQVARLTQILSLTTEQQTKAATIFTTAETALANTRTSMESAHTALTSAIESNDTNAISAAATQIGTLTAQQIQTHAEAQAALYAILTPEQQSKYKTFLTMGPRGFGPPPPPPGGPVPPVPPPGQ